MRKSRSSDDDRPPSLRQCTLTIDCDNLPSQRSALASRRTTLTSNCNDLASGQCAFASRKREPVPNEDGLVGRPGRSDAARDTLFSMRVDVAKRSMDFLDGRVSVRSRVSDFVTDP
jgi:hypothetical protein